ncbi:MAG: hypothetical protein KDN19_06105 [Verrucomicrobiae bacterium]|nr:hypothetical protein [Verrucomicrobiae bacterium]
MNPVEKLLKQGLDAEPEDWSVRLELASKLAERGAGEEFDQLLREAPVAPEEDSQAHRIVELANQCQSWEGLKQVLALYAAARPDSSWARLVYAQTLLHLGDAATALVHYRHARRLDASISDESLDHLLAEHEAKVAAANQATEAAKAARKAEAEKASVTEEATPVVPAARPLKPPGGGESEEASSEEAPAVVAVAAIAEDHEPHPHHVSLAPEEGVPMAMPHDEGEPDYEFDHDHHRAFIVGEGEMVHAQQKESDGKQKVSALTVAVLAHVVIALLLGFYVVSQPRPNPPQITATALPNLDSNELEQKEIKKVQRAPVQTASAQMQVTTVAAASSVAMPEIQSTLTTFDPIGMGDNFGSSMSFDMGDDGGMVSFFGAKSISKKVVFVVDFSASMSGAKDKLMRKELAKSIEALPNGVKYQLIMFSGPAWYAGQETTKAKPYKDGKIAHIVKDKSKEYVWYEGWSEDERHDGGKKSALYHYSEGEDKLPESDYITASRANIRKTLKQIEDTPLSFGTDWRWPLRMAMNMEPDTIYFMTDGAFGTGKGFKKEDMMKELLRYNADHGRAKINTICMMVLQARTELEQLADGSRGEFTLVLEDGTVVRGKELDKFGKKK